MVFGDATTATIFAQRTNDARFQMDVYAPNFNNTSARSEKTAVEPVDPGEILAGVRSLSVNTWPFDREGDEDRHIGPMAREFNDTFPIDGDHGNISTVDADGVFLAAIQGLAEKDDEKDDQIAELEAENEQLRERIDTLETRLVAIEEHLPGLY